jgi:hypothetical protein
MTVRIREEAWVLTRDLETGKVLKMTRCDDPGITAAVSAVVEMRARECLG